MVFSAPLRILLLCLLHFSTCAVGEDVNPVILQSIVQRFQSKLAKDIGQYTVAFRVEKKICSQDSSGYPKKNLLTKVKQKLLNNDVYQSNNKDIIAAKADKVLKLHSEFRLKNYLKDIVDVKDKCVVYFTYNSPCLSKCLSDKPDNIKASLTQLEDYAGIKALAFQNFFGWKDGSNQCYNDRQAVIDRLKAIAPALPYYQCKNNRCDRL